jgi:hypothetical protein
MELDPAYTDVIVERWQKATGRKAEREGSKPSARERKTPQVDASSRGKQDA